MSDSLISAEALELLYSLAYIVAYNISLALSLILYVSMGIGLHRMARSCGLRHGWIAWLPYCQTYAIGRIADHQCSVNEDHPTTYRRGLLTIHILQSVASALATTVTLGIYFVDIFKMVFDGTLEALMEDSAAYSTAISDLILSSYGKAWFFWLIVVLFSILFTVFYVIAVYKIGKLFLPKVAALFAILTAVPVVQNISQILFFLLAGFRKPRYMDTDAPTSISGGEMFYTL